MVGPTIKETHPIVFETCSKGIDCGRNIGLRWVFNVFFLNTSWGVFPAIAVYCRNPGHFRSKNSCTNTAHTRGIVLTAMWSLFRLRGNIIIYIDRGKEYAEPPLYTGMKERWQRLCFGEIERCFGWFYFFHAGESTVLWFNMIPNFLTGAAWWIIPVGYDMLWLWPSSTWITTY